MSKAELRILTTLGAAAAGLAFIHWLRSKPTCNLGCQNQLEHLEKHVLAAAGNSLAALLLMLLGIR